MRGTTAVLGATVALALLSGCASRYADVPQPTRFEASKQTKLQAAQHWQIIANDFATQLSNDLRQKGINQPLYIPTGKDDYAFVEGFRELLTTAMLAQGWDIRTSARNALPVDIRYSIYKFRRDRLTNTRHYGEATVGVTSMAAGLWAVREVANGKVLSSTGEAILGVGLLMGIVEGLDWLSHEAPGGPQRGQHASGPVPQSEILVTASVSDGDRLVARRSNIYFTADEDKALYWNKPGQGTELRLKGE